MNHFPKKPSPTQSSLTKTSDSKYRQLKASRKNSHIWTYVCMCVYVSMLVVIWDVLHSKQQREPTTTAAARTTQKVQAEKQQQLLVTTGWGRLDHNLRFVPGPCKHSYTPTHEQCKREIVLCVCVVGQPAAPGNDIQKIMIANWHLTYGIWSIRTNSVYRKLCSTRACTYTTGMYRY